MANKIQFNVVRFTDANGDPVPGAQARFYESGTTTPITVYSDAAGTIAHATPVVADGSGVFPHVFTTEDIVRVIITDSDDASLPGGDIDPAVLSSATTVNASGVGFSATANVPELNVQDAIEHAGDNLNGEAASYYLDADNINAGTLGHNRLPKPSQAVAEAMSSDEYAMTPLSTGYAIAASLTESFDTAANSGTAIDLTGIADTAKEIDLILNAVELDGSNALLIQLGTSSGFTTSGYNSASMGLSTTTSSTSGMAILSGAGFSGTMRLINCGNDIWMSQHHIFVSGTSNVRTGSGIITLADTLTQVRFAPSGANNFTGSGTVGIRYR